MEKKLNSLIPVCVLHYIYVYVFLYCKKNTMVMQLSLHIRINALCMINFGKDENDLVSWEDHGVPTPS